MHLQTNVDGATYRAKISDRMAFSDHTAFRALLKDVSASGATRCVLDLSGLVSIDSSGLGMFMVAHETGRSSGWSLTLEKPQGHVKTLLQLGKFDKILKIED